MMYTNVSSSVRVEEICLWFIDTYFSVVLGLSLGLVNREYLYLSHYAHGEARLLSVSYNIMGLFANHIVPWDMKGCISHFAKWQLHLFISKGTNYDILRYISFLRYIKFTNFNPFSAGIFFIRQNLTSVYVKFIIIFIIIISLLKKSKNSRILNFFF